MEILDLQVHFVYTIKSGYIHYGFTDIVEV